MNSTYASQNADSEIAEMARQTLQNVETLRDLWADAASDALSNMRARNANTVSVEGQENTLFDRREDYSYEALISKPDMKLTILNEYDNYDRKTVISDGLNNARLVGKTINGNTFVNVKDIDSDVMVSRRSIEHGLDRRFSVQAPALSKIGEILENSIRLNELVPKKKNASNSYALIGAAASNNNLYLVSFIVNRFSNEISDINVLHAANTKKESAALLPEFTDKSAPPTDSVISISKLLDYVNKYFPDIMPESVYKHYGHSERPSGVIGQAALYSLREVDPIQPTSNKWSRTLTTSEAKQQLPNLWDVSADESEVRNPTQIKSTVNSLLR